MALAVGETRIPEAIESPTSKEVGHPLLEVGHPVYPLIRIYEAGDQADSKRRRLRVAFSGFLPLTTSSVTT